MQPARPLSRQESPIWEFWESFFRERPESIRVAATIGKVRPCVIVTLRDPTTGRQARIQVPPAEAPEAVAFLRSLNGIVRRSPALDAVSIHSKPLTPVVEADFDDHGRLVLKPLYRSLENVFPADQVEKGTIRGTRWFWDGRGFYRIANPAPAIAPYFDPAAKLVYEEEEIPEFLEKDFPTLARQIHFRASESVRRSAIVSPRLSGVRIRPGAPGWFTLDLKFDEEAHTFALQEILRRQGKAKYVRNGNAWVPLEHVRKEIERHDLRPAVRWEEVKEIRSRGLKVDVHRIPLRGFSPAPQGLRSSLREYQKAGLDWLWWLRKSGFGGILADDMGLGKTHQTMALLVSAYEEGAPRPSLIICPASVVEHWAEKIRDHAPGLMPYLHRGESRLRRTAEMKALRVVLTTYGILSRDHSLLSEVDWEYVVLDEAHLIKNPSTRLWKAVKQLRSAHRLALTGTPIENRPIELWSIFDFLQPGALGSFEDFRQEKEPPILREDPGAIEELRSRIAPFVLRRVKEDVLQELPPKQEDKLYCDMTVEQEALYRAVVESRAKPMLEKLKDRSCPLDPVPVFALLTRLKQICDHPALVLERPDPALASGKFEVFQELLDQCLASDRKVVVFTQYVRMLEILRGHLERLGVGFAEIHGGVRDRAEPVRRFREDRDCRVFLASLLAAGVGIDLQSASVVVHYDRWWNPGKEEQATDRVHRMGQTRGVQVYKLITRGSVEEKIDALIERKGEMFDSLVQAEGGCGRAMSREDLIELLE